MAMLTEDGLQYHVRLKEGDIGKYAFLPGDPFWTDVIAGYLDDAKLVAHNREYKTWTGYLDGEKVPVTSTGMGCPSTAICVEELIKVDARTPICIGTVGSVKDKADCEKYDRATCTATIRDEGTTIHYIPVKYPAVVDRHVVDALARAAGNRGLHFLGGITQSKDSLYGEVDPDSSPNAARLRKCWEAWKKGNAVCSEIGSAALFIVASIRGVRAGAIINWGDIEQTIETACDAVGLLIKQEKDVG